MTLPPLSFSFSDPDNANSGPGQAVQVTPWNQGDVVIATGGSTAKSGDRTAPSSTASLLSGLGLNLGGGLYGMPQQSYDQPGQVVGGGVSMGISSGAVVIAGVIVVGALAFRFLRK